MAGRIGRFLCALAVLTPAPESVGAKAKNIPLRQKVKESHFVGRVRVLSTTTQLHSNRYRSVARLQVLHVIKGPPQAKSFELAFDNGLNCPNVRYTAGEDCLLFARWLDWKTLHTYNSQNDKYFVKDGLVRSWSRGPRSSQDVPFDKVAASLSLMAGPKALSFGTWETDSDPVMRCGGVIADSSDYGEARSVFILGAFLPYVLILGNEKRKTRRAARLWADQTGDPGLPEATLVRPTECPESQVLLRASKAANSSLLSPTDDQRA